MKDNFASIYDLGPTSCYPQKEVVKSIKEEIKACNALSRGDIRLAAAMGLINADIVRQIGYNDAVFYPLSDAPSMAKSKSDSPSDLVSLSSTKKNLHALALLVDFPDNQGTRPKAEFEKMLFDATNPDSMTSFYKDISYGNLSLTGEVIGYIRAPHPYTYYTNGKSGTGNTYPKNTPGLLVDALTTFCQNDSLARFDTDNDGFVDGIFLIHAGGGAEAEPDPNKRKDMIWSHKWTLPQPFVNNNIKVFAYSTEPEDGKVGVFAHEFGHVLGLPDLYDTNYNSKGLGDWCLMSGGSWGGGGDKPTRMSCWCLSKLGWISPTNVITSKTITLDTLENNKNDCYRLWTKGNSGLEYFLIENKQKKGRDTELPGAGLAVWHIDENQQSNTNPLSYLVGLVQADGKRDLEFNRNGGDNGDLFPGTTGNVKLNDSSTPSTRANDGSKTGVSLTNISEQNGKIKLKVKV